MIDGAAKLAHAIFERRRVTAQNRAIVVAISGIDASGKGTLAAALTRLLRGRGFTVEPVGADAWLNPLERLALGSDPGVEFYRRGIRFGEMFRRLGALGRQGRTPDVIVVEGIFLFKKALRHRYDLTIWLECGFETALQRALARNQEGLSSERLIEDYRRIYFPAQKVHLERDFPLEFAEIVHRNDPNLPAVPLQSQNT